MRSRSRCVIDESFSGERPNREKGRQINRQRDREGGRERRRKGRKARRWGERQTRDKEIGISKGERREARRRNKREKGRERGRERERRLWRLKSESERKYPLRRRRAGGRPEEGNIHNLLLPSAPPSPSPLPPLPGGQAGELRRHLGACLTVRSKSRSVSVLMSIHIVCLFFSRRFLFVSVIWLMQIGSCICLVLSPYVI